MTNTAPSLAPLARDAAPAAILEGLLGYVLRRAQLRVYADLAQALLVVGLRPVTFSVMAIIESMPGLNQAAVGDALGIRRANLVAIAVELETAGWILRAPSSQDRRQYVLSLTHSGHAQMQQAWPVVRAHDARIAATLAEVDRHRLLDALRQTAPGRAVCPVPRSPVPSMQRKARV